MIRTGDTTAYGSSQSKQSTSPNASTQPPTTTGQARLTTNNPYASIPAYDNFPTRPSTNISVPAPPPSQAGSYFKNITSSINKVNSTSPFYTWGPTPPIMNNRTVPAPPPRGTTPAIFNNGNNLPVAAAPPTKTTTTQEPDWSTLPALLPEQQLAYRMAVRDARRDFEMMQNQVQLGRKQARRDFRQATREVNRDQTGQSTNLASALAFLGLDTSPATMGVGLQDIETQSDIARSEVAAMRAQREAELDMQLTQARIGRNQALSAAQQTKLANQASRATDMERYQMGGQ